MHGTRATIYLERRCELILKKRWDRSIVGRCSKVFSRRDQRLILAFTFIQIGLSFFDLLGLAVIGLLGSLAVSGVQSQAPSSTVQVALETIGLDSMSLQTQSAVLGLLAAFFLIGRSLLSVVFTRRYTFFLSRRSAVISARLTARLLSQSLLFIQSRTTMYFLNALTSGVQSITVGVVGTLISLTADLSLMIVLSFGLFIVDPLISISSLLFFVFVAITMYRLTHVRARKLGDQNLQFGVKSNEKILEVISSYRESVVRNRRGYYAREIGELRYKLANTVAEISFLPSISKYVIETSAIVVALLVAGSQFILYDASRAVATLTIFVVAITRIAPAVLRFQQSAISIKSSLSQAESALELVEAIDVVEDLDFEQPNLDLEHSGFVPQIKVSNVTFSYPNRTKAVLRDISFTIRANSTVAIVGASGAGKTTLADILLGVLQPNSGSVLISDFLPLSSISKWPGAISYVPQDVLIVNGSIRENVGLGFPNLEEFDSLIWETLTQAKLDRFVKNLPLGLSTPVGERGTQLSGGQRQRLGIARALFTRPKLIILDEATSALDASTEFEVSQAFASLRNQATLIVIAHRLSTVKNADSVIYLEDGVILAHDSFGKVREKIPDFDLQAKLMGL